MKNLSNQIELELIVKARTRWIKDSPYWRASDVREVISEVLSEWDSDGRPKEWKRSVEVPL